MTMAAYQCLRDADIPDRKMHCQRTLALLELDSPHISLRLHKRKGRYSELLSVFIQYACGIALQCLIEGKRILCINMGAHDELH